MANTTTITDTTDGTALAFFIDDDDFGAQRFPDNLAAPKESIKTTYAGGTIPVELYIQGYPYALKLDTAAGTITVAGVAATDNADLYSKIIALL